MDDYFDATDPRQTAYESDRAQLLSAMLARAGDEGWTQTALARAAGDVAMPPERVALVFPDGVEDVLAYDSAVLDRAMVARLLPATLENLRIRARIALGLRLRIEALSSQEAAAHRAAAMLALPRFAPLGLRLAYQTIDRLWRAIGDTSTDFNFYTKRGLTVGVYLATLAAWFGVGSADLFRVFPNLGNFPVRDLGYFG